MATITVLGRPCLDTVKDQKSHLVLASDTPHTFDNTSKVSTVVDDTHADVKLEWAGEKFFPFANGTRMGVRIKMIKTTPKGTTPKKEGKLADPPSPGTITVTVTSPSATPTAPTDYVNDDGT